MIKFLQKIIFIFLAFAMTSPFAFAQEIPLNGNLVLTPQNPAPYELVNIKLESYSFDPARSSIIWSVNNKIIKSGYGETSVSLKTGKEGSQTIIRVTAITNDSQKYEAGITLTPQNIDLVWEATESYTPPFYKGKALPGEGSLVKITAIPSFYSGTRKIPAENLSYSWSLNGTVAQDLSGYGKRTFMTYLDYLSNTNEIKVVAQTLDGNSAEKRITILPNKIDPIFYEYDPTLGPNYAHALPDFFEIKKDLFLNIEPYFISNKGESSSGVEYNWSLNGLPITPTDDTHVTLHPKEGYVGVSTINVSISNTKRVLQEIQKKIEVSFGQKMI